jgi:hypothetical protein
MYTWGGQSSSKCNIARQELHKAGMLILDITSTAQVPLLHKLRRTCARCSAVTTIAYLIDVWCLVLAAVLAVQLSPAALAAGGQAAQVVVVHRGAAADGVLKVRHDAQQALQSTKLTATQVFVTDIV